MAEQEKTLIKFGYLTKEEMATAIQNHSLTAYDICFTKDTKEQFILDGELNPIAIKSQVRVYQSEELALTDIKATTQTYSGEIIAVYKDGKFKAYVVEPEEDSYIIEPVYANELVDYNKIQNAPITNLVGTLSEPIVISNLAYGNYNISGTITTPDGVTSTARTSNYFLVGENYVKRISDSGINDYYIDGSSVTVDTYITKAYLEEQNYASTTYVDEKMAAFKVSMEQYIVDYVDQTVTNVVRQIVLEELANHLITEEEIDELFS